MKTQGGKRWVIPFAAGIALCSLCWVAWRRSHPPIDPVLVRAATEVGANPQELSEAFQLLQEAEEKRALSEVSWNRTKQLFASDNYSIKNKAMSVMLLLGKTPHRAEVLSLTKPLLQDPKWQLQSLSL